jgi:hypothetical protein
VERRWRTPPDARALWLMGEAAESVNHKILAWFCGHQSIDGATQPDASALRLMGEEQSLPQVLT